MMGSSSGNAELASGAQHRRPFDNRPTIGYTTARQRRQKATMSGWHLENT